MCHPPIDLLGDFLTSLVPSVSPFGGTLRLGREIEYGSAKRNGCINFAPLFLGEGAWHRNKTPLHAEKCIIYQNCADLWC